MNDATASRSPREFASRILPAESASDAAAQPVGIRSVNDAIPVVASQARTPIRRLVAIISWTVLVTGLLLGCSQSGEQEHPGKAVYERYCYACHQAGIADAPKLGDREAWTARLAKPREELLENIKRGMTPGMPPRGGCPSCTDEALETALDYIVSKAE